MKSDEIAEAQDLKILHSSPHDAAGWEDDKKSGTENEIQHWVPSRYTVRAATDDGQLILWNTLSRTISVFKKEQAPYVLAMLKPAGVQSREEGLAGYLARRGVLIPKGTDEYSKFLLMFGQQHYRSDVLELFVLSSEDCNFRCTYCYERFTRGTMRPEVRQGIKRMVEKQIKNLRTLDIRWFGGEPLYGWAAVEELAPFFRRISQEYGVNHRSQMTTNGYLLTPDVADRLLDWNVRSYQITLDGVPDTHNCSRPTRDGRPTFETIVENLKSLGKRTDEFYVNLRVNFDKTNSNRLEEFLDLVKKELNPDSRFNLAFHPVGRWGGANDPQLQVCGGDEKVNIMTQLKEAAHARGLRVNNLKDYNYLGGMVCYAARPYNLIIGASGKVMKCTVLLDMDERNVVGRLMEDGSLLLNNNKMARWTEPSFEKDAKCQKCFVLPNCQGISCPLPRLDENKRPCIPTKLRAKAELREALKFGTAVVKREVAQTVQRLEEKP
ncbi:Arylsulfatase regulator [Cystobacter fuscus DSM 2262]|uniref:Arylsulfatase regulator n=1 Tax=Cystobacter fuscus (strain ATCC 25194 / DSM 2262 / NBRC 100088 / M29) TaxID=1242864 RepID=S9P985_CYSF2|nr:radical SAM protein [Cystobacter fuscus]EPX59651.1 Arylsulfatase regulator [Cystobacter fuscus DSM 2262]